MKKLKKFLSLVLASILLMSCFSLFSYAYGSKEKAVNYPFILVHGLGGWGQYDAMTETFP